MRLLLAMALVATAAAPTLAWADGGTTATLTVTGDVAQACSLASLSGDGSFVVGGGNLLDPTTGQLKSGLTTNGNQTITGSWCNGASTITVTATPLQQTTFSGAPPNGFSKSVNFTATASGWGANNVVVATAGDASGLNPTTNSGSQTVGTAASSTITVGLGSFVTGGSATNKLVAGNYTGSVVITLATSP
jgi:hypothetical protein